MAEVISVLRYLFTAAAGAVTALGSLYLYTSVYSTQATPRSRPLRVLITAAGGHIGYALAPLVARGVMCGARTPIFLHMHDQAAAAQVLAAVEMEAMDLASHLLLGVTVSHDLEEACQDVDVAVLLSGVPLRAACGVEESIARSAALYAELGAALEAHASRDVKVVIVPTPASTNALVLRRSAPSIPAENITTLTRLAHNRMLAQVADQLAVAVSEVRNVAVWGDAASDGQVLDIQHASVCGTAMANVVDQEFEAELQAAVQQRSSSIVRARNMTPALSAAGAICDHVHDWLLGSRRGDWVSMGVASDGSYGVPPGLFFSFPVTCQHGCWQIVQGLAIDDRMREDLEACIGQLEAERELI